MQPKLPQRKMKAARPLLAGARSDAQPAASTSQGAATAAMLTGCDR
jgi:hypothetical protein